MRCQDILDKIEARYPRKYACDWDNVGLLAGSREREVDTVYIALDATDEVVDAASECGAQLLLTHHPMIFGGLKSVTTDDYVGERLIRLIRNDISYYAMHTNYDVMGMAELAADMLDLKDTKALEEVLDGEGIGRVGGLSRSMTVKECAELVKERFGLPNVKIFGNLDQKVHLAALCPGAGKSTMHNALQFGCDVYITGDIDHHTGIDAVDQGLCIIDAGHYGMEHVFMEDVKAYLEKVLTGVHMDCVPVKHPFAVI